MYVLMILYKFYPIAKGNDHQKKCVCVKFKLRFLMKNKYRIITLADTIIIFSHKTHVLITIISRKIIFLPTGKCVFS